MKVDGETVYDGRSWQVIVAVSGAFGGGSGVAEADPDDGVLDVVVLPAGSRLGLARRAYGLRTRTIASQHDVDHHRGHVVEVELPPNSELNVDGEIRQHGLDRVTVEPRAIVTRAPRDRVARMYRERRPRIARESRPNPSPAIRARAEGADVTASRGEGVGQPRR